MALSDSKVRAELPLSVLGYFAGKWVLLEIDFGYAGVAKILPENCYIFMDEETYARLRNDPASIAHSFNIPDLASSSMCFKSNGYFGCQRAYDEDVKLKSYSTWFRCLVKMMGDENTSSIERQYIWYEMSFFTQWNRPGHCRVMCVGTPSQLQSGLTASLQKVSQRAEPSDPFALHPFLIEQIAILYDDSIWRLRDQVRNFEKGRLRASPSFEDLHEVARHAIHITEVLSVAINTVEKLQQKQEQIHQVIGRGLGLNFRLQAKEHIGFVLELLKAFKLRSESNHERLKNEITLAYNAITLQDNTVVKAIALLTTLFLPATFFAAFFSTTFFDFAENQLKVSSKLWIYWAATIPSTFIIAGACILWVHFYPMGNPFTLSLWRNPLAGNKRLKEDVVA